MGLRKRISELESEVEYLRSSARNDRFLVDVITNRLDGRIAALELECNGASDAEVDELRRQVEDLTGRLAFERYIADVVYAGLDAHYGMGSPAGDDVQWRLDLYRDHRYGTDRGGRR